MGKGKQYTYLLILLIFCYSEILDCVNQNLKNIVTSVKVKEYEMLLKEAGYDQQKTKFLVDGFTKGFSLNYIGPRKVRRKAKNLILRIGSKTELWNKIRWR